MVRPYQIFYPLFSLFLVRVDLTDIKPLPLSVYILKVYDGDTVLVRKGSFQAKVRLARIDAPEKGQPFVSKSGDAGALSAKCLRKNLKTQGELLIDGVDMYGRLLGDIDRVSLDLVKQGCVSLYPFARFESEKEKYIYLRAINQAKNKKFGLWAFGGIEQPKAWRKKNKKKFRKRIEDPRSPL